jgi:hypothetical protein
MVDDHHKKDKNTALPILVVLFFSNSILQRQGWIDRSIFVCNLSYGPNLAPSVDWVLLFFFGLVFQLIILL